MQSIIPDKRRIKITIEVEGTNIIHTIEGFEEVHFVSDTNFSGRVAMFSDEADAKMFEKTRAEKARV